MIKALMGRKARTAAVVMTSGVLVSVASATPPDYVTDIGIDPTDVIGGLASVLTPFLVAAITIGFGFFAVKVGVRWIKGMAWG